MSSNSTETVFGEDIRAQAREIIARYPEGKSRSALLPMLHLTQSVEGYVSPACIKFCAEMLDLSEAAVTAVATFYSMYKRQPTGEYLVSVCTNTLCGMLGGDEIYEVLQRELGVGGNETTPDGKVTLEHAECLAACDYAPVVTVNYEYFDQQTQQSAKDVVRALRAGEPPTPTRGAPLCTFKQVERMLAGFPDEREDALAGGRSGGEPTFAGLRLTEGHGMADVAGASELAGDIDPAERHEGAGEHVPATPQSGQSSTTRRVTSEVPPSGGVARKAAEHAEDARERLRDETGEED
ncbi:MAG: NADH-quinone oxidoreductase subunit NuoE [Streptosporangiales bacterium]|nr:NADH-quinone oxidoreductase subunit NuoE [Streptosporangiales bacterium]